MPNSVIYISPRSGKRREMVVIENQPYYRSLDGDGLNREDGYFRPFLMLRGTKPINYARISADYNKENLVELIGNTLANYPHNIVQANHHTFSAPRDFTATFSAAGHAELSHEFATKQQMMTSFRLVGERTRQARQRGREEYPDDPILGRPDPLGEDVLRRAGCSEREIAWAKTHSITITPPNTRVAIDDPDVINQWLVS